MRGFRLCAWPLLAVAVVLAVASVYYTVTHLTIRTSRNDLVASNQRLIQQTEKMDRAFGGRDGMVVVVENGHPKRAIKFANDLAAELRRYPDHFPELFYHIDPESFKRSALLYLDPQGSRQDQRQSPETARPVVGPGRRPAPDHLLPAGE